MSYPIHNARVSQEGSNSFVARGALEATFDDYAGGRVPEGDFLRVAMRNKYTGFVAAAPVGDNTWGVTQQGFDLDSAPPGQLWTFGAVDDAVGRFIQLAAETKISAQWSARRLAAKSASGTGAAEVGGSLVSCAHSALNELFRCTG
jgi:hypothetical protein